jgi:hypothetical protein
LDEVLDTLPVSSLKGSEQTKHFGVHVAGEHYYQHPIQGQPGLHNATHLAETNYLNGI